MSTEQVNGLAIDPAILAFLRANAAKGGKKRAESMTAQQRIEQAKKAAAKRWGKKGGE